ncbi:hypothetical protein EJ110_NYTH30721 [Nymphaea thermarum]|nr:hypothetical protein EJ110_NYTH30721 [Nymphaea thermarum]
MMKLFRRWKSGSIFLPLAVLRCFPNLFDIPASLISVGIEVSCLFHGRDLVLGCHSSRLPSFRWDIIWLPLGPLSAAGICLYVDNLLMESLVEIAYLEDVCLLYYAINSNHLRHGAGSLF